MNPLPETILNLKVFSILFENQNKNGIMIKSDSLIIKLLLMAIYEIFEFETSKTFELLIQTEVDKTKINFIENLDFLKNKQKKKVLLWILLVFYEKEILSIANLILNHSGKESLLFKYQSEIIRSFERITRVNYTIDSPITKSYELFLLEMQSPTKRIFQPFHYSLENTSNKLSSNNSIKSIEEDPINNWKLKLIMIPFSENEAEPENEPNEEKEKSEEDLIALDSDYINKFIKNFEMQHSSMSFFLKENIDFLNENLKYKLISPTSKLKNSISLDKTKEFIKNCHEFIFNLSQRKKDIIYLKNHTFPNDYYLKENKLDKLIEQVEYLIKLADDYYNELMQSINDLKLEDFESPLEIKLSTQTSPMKSEDRKNYTSKRRRIKNSRKLYLQKYNDLDFNWKFKEKPQEKNVSYQFLSIFKYLLAC